MIVDTNAYLISLIMIFISFIVRDFIVPLFVWRKHLKNRSYGYVFWFCIITQATIKINAVLILGLLNVLNRITFISLNIIVYSLISWNYSDKQIFKKIKKNSLNLWTAYKKEKLVFFLISSFGDSIKSIGRRIYNWNIWRYIKKHWLELILLAGIVIYNIWFMTYNLMTYHSYQFSDFPVHQSWIYQLEQGNLYVEGIYPFGMHAMIYSIRAFFAFNLREILLYAGAYQFTLLIIGIYILAKEIFVGKYSSIAVILITSLLLNQGRYAAALPQEIGMYAVVAVAYFMIRYLHSNQKKNIIESDSRIRRLFRVKTYINRRYISSELILLTLSVALVISYHYYTAFAAVFIIIAIGLGYIFKILRKQYFLPLLFCGVMGVVIAVLPTGLGLAKGIPFQESIDWALTVMSGEEWRGSDLDYQVNLDAAIGGGIIEEDNLEDDLDIIIVEDDKIDYSKMSLKDIIRHYYDSIYDFGFYSMYGEGPTKVLFICMVIGLISALIMFLYKKTRSSAYDYMALIIMMLIFFTLGASKELGIPEVIAAARASTFAQAFTGLIYVLPVDFIFRILKKVKKPSYKVAVNFLSLGVCGLSAFIIVEKGWYHNFFDVNVAYYNETEYVLRNIKKDFKKNSYTIVSPTDERYDVIDHGRHTELSQFVNMINGNEEMFTFTTDYVFFFIEKKLLQDKNVGSVYVSQEYAEMDFFYMGDVQDYYFQRAVIESKAYYWAKEFEKTYPRNFKVYFENDIYIVYLLKQNTYSPYNLQIRDK